MNDKFRSDRSSSSKDEEPAVEEGSQAANGAGSAGTTPAQEENGLAAQYLSALQRERADFINYRRRAEQERDEISQRASAALLKKLLPIVDDFDRAINHLPEEEKGRPWVDGVTAIARKLHGLLDSEGVTTIEALNQPFDPNLHEAVAFEESGSDGNHVDVVSEVFGQGYKHRDRVLRPAIVKVTRG